MDTRPIDVLLSDMGRRLGLEGLRLDERDKLILKVDGRPLSLQYASGVLLLLSPVADMPEAAHARLAVAELLLRRNCFFSGTGGGTIGLHSDERIWYSLRIPADSMDYLPFESAILAALDACSALAAEIAGLAEAAPAPGAPHDPHADSGIASSPYFDMLRV